MSSKADILAQKWVVEGDSVYTQDKELVAIATSPATAEYILALHIRCFHMPYVAGQLDLELAPV